MRNKEGAIYASLLKKGLIASKIWEFFGFGSINVFVNTSFLHVNRQGGFRMTRFFLLLLVALVSAPAVLAQDIDYSRYECVGGYAFERASNNAATMDKNGRAT